MNFPFLFLSALIFKAKLNPDKPCLRMVTSQTVQLGNFLYFTILYLKKFRFEVNFLSGSPTIDPHIGDVVLHISVRFDEGKIVFNTMKVNFLKKYEAGYHGSLSFDEHQT